jgi:hypothetical protein
MAINGNQGTTAGIVSTRTCNRSTVITINQWQSMAINGNQWQSMAINGNQGTTAGIVSTHNGHSKSPEAIKRSSRGH